MDHTARGLLSARRERVAPPGQPATPPPGPAEKGIAAHPAQSVVGALLVGILIGRLLGRHC
jgi:hypothetical protein